MSLKNASSLSEEKNSISDSNVHELPTVENVDDVHELDYSQEEYSRLLKKMDWILLPLMWVAYGVQQADKTGISTQALFNFRQDNGLVGQQYSWCVLLCQFPMSYLMQRVSVGKTLSVLMFFWGIVVLCTAFAHNWAGLMVLRTLQGLLECTISPSFLLIIGTWYKTSEHASRSIIWGTANAGFGVIVSLCMYAIGNSATNHKSGLAAWKGISFFLGGTTILLSIVAWFFLGTPREVAWVSKEERRIAQARIVSNKTGTDHHKRRDWKKDQVIEAFLDPSTWFLFCSVVLGALPNGGITSFGNLVYTSFGFTSLQTILYGIPQNVVSIFWFLLMGYLCRRVPRSRFYIMLVSIVPAFVGLLALALLPSSNSFRWIKFGMYFMTVTSNINGLLLWMHVPSNVGGRTKKSVVSSIMFIAYCVGNAGGSQFFLAKDAPRYIPALIACSICLGLEFVFILVWRIWLSYQNHSRDKAAEAAGLTPEQIKVLGAENGERDMTDRQNPHFRYNY
ncbi:MFS general substrate transporter [Rhodocollybia butyracea]|uniref:MFS general substrate transporter n=1 Tax=Rhodocollybia butyracea TaxID=206335 RepID=A0A9P5U2J6_9AGAR|nr:MFS general substrate transporter [Rhodocollybia butyracea]